MFGEAAVGGDPEAQYYVGRMYADGEVVERDYAEACFWLALAAAQEHDRAITSLRKIELEVGPEVAAQAKSRAKEWLSK